ncbi:MAG: STAS domain-containing protein [Pirellulales bacterium]
MENVIQDREITIIELDRNYDSLDDAPLTRLQNVLNDAVGAGGKAVSLLIDMSRTTTINSSFIGMLFATGKQLKTNGGQLSLCAADAFCSDVMRVVRLNQMFNTYPTRDEALDAMHGGATSAG